jgi:hypothetical protein
VLLSTQFPSDDGSCAALTSTKECMAKVSMLDNTAHKCEWKGTTDDCAYVDPVITARVRDSISLLNFLCVNFCL